MAKAKESKKNSSDGEAYVFSGTSLVERSGKRDVIKGPISADVGLGGGIPLGCTMLFGGKPKSGKTTSVLQYAANAQRDFGCDIYYFNVEGRLDSKTLSQIQNLNLEKLHIVMGPPILDKEGNVIGNKKMSSQQWWTIIGRHITEHARSVMIVDSVSALSEAAELEEGMGFASRGGLQKLEAQFVRQYGDLVMTNNITLFLLAQIQANTSGYGDPIQIKCGNAIKHMADGIVFIKGIEKWDATSEGRILGHDMNWKVETSPLGCPLIETKVKLRYGKGLDVEGDIVENGMTWDLIKTAGAWYTIPFKKTETGVEYEEVQLDDNDKPLNGIRVQGTENVRTWFVQNREALDILDQKIREKIFLL